MPEPVDASITFDEMALPDEVLAVYNDWLAEKHISASVRDEFALGRVIKHDRGYPLIVSDHGTFRAEHEIEIVKSVDMRVAIGDWVCLRLAADHDMARIVEILPRAGVMSRFDPRGHQEKQILAVNIDLALVAVALSPEPLDPRQIMSAIVIALDANVSPVVVLTKTDRKRSPEDLASDVMLATEVVGESIPVVSTSSVAELGIDVVRALVDSETTAVILGVSGAGKSSLLNALLGENALATSEVRKRDDAGRHTTVAREMVSIPGGGLIIDTPGMRSMSLRDHKDGVDLAFPDITGYAEGCRFRDCTHTDEPGCKVLAAVAEGVVSPMRLDAYRRVMTEITKSRNATDPALLSRKRKQR